MVVSGDITSASYLLCFDEILKVALSDSIPSILFKKMKHCNFDVIGYWVIGAGC